MKNYILALSLIINLWFQFRSDLTWKYVEWRVCKDGSELTGMSINEYEILGLAPLHIPNIIRLGPINENEYECGGIE